MDKIKFFAKKQIENLRSAGQSRTADAYDTAVRSLLAFTGEDIHFDDLTEKLLKDFEMHLIEGGKAMNTVSCYMRMLHATYNHAHDAKKITRYRRHLFKDVFTRDSEYLLPPITHRNKPVREQYTAALRVHNKCLSQMGNLLNGDYKLTSYVARHSWATIAKNEGVPLPVISEGVGHNSERTTCIYLGSFDEEIMSQANRKVIASIQDTAKM